MKAKSILIYIILFFPCLQGSEVKMQNITTQFLSSLSATQFQTIYSTVARSLPPNQRCFTNDWVNETITSWCKNDSFHNHLEKGNTLTVPYLIKFIKSRNITIRDKWGKDALNRGRGLRTKDERKLYTEEEQIIRSSHCPTEIHFEVDEETSQVTEFVVADTYFEDKADIERNMSEIREYCSPRVRDRWQPYISQFFDLYFQQYSNTETAQIIGLTNDELRQLLNNVRQIARDARKKGLL